MIFEKNNIDVPEHLNEELFHEVITRAANSHECQLKKVTFHLASAPGDNYSSKIYRAQADYTTPHSAESVSLIIKTMPALGYTDVLDLYDVYQKEKVAYFKVHHHLKKLLPDVHFGPKCYYAAREPMKTLIFEDLRTRNFRNVRREEGLDEYHARMILEKLGQYHAGTSLFCEKDSEIFEEFKQSHFNEEVLETNLMRNVFVGHLEEIKKLAEKWPGYEDIAKKLDKIIKNFKKIVLELVDPSKDFFKVCNHGDFWIGNMMFQYSSEEATKSSDVAFIDFQNGFIASPGIDLNYFLNTSVQFDVLKNRRHELIGYYYNSLSKTLRQLGVEDIPTEDAVRNEILRKELYGLISLCAVAPIIFLDPKVCQGNSLETLADETKLKEKHEVMFSSPRLIEILQYSLKRFDELKVLDTD